MSLEERVNQIENKIKYLFSRVSKSTTITSSHDQTDIADLLTWWGQIKTYGFDTSSLSNLIGYQADRSDIQQRIGKLDTYLAQQPINSYEGAWPIHPKTYGQLKQLLPTYATRQFNVSNLVFIIQASINTEVQKGAWFGVKTKLEWVYDTTVKRITYQLYYDGGVICSLTNQIPTYKGVNVAPTNQYFEISLGDLTVKMLEYNLESVTTNYQLTPFIMQNTRLLDSFCQDIPSGMEAEVTTSDFTEMLEAYRQKMNNVAKRNMYLKLLAIYQEEIIKEDQLASSSAVAGVYALTKIDNLASRTVQAIEVTYDMSLNFTNTQLPEYPQYNRFAIDGSVITQANDYVDVYPFSTPKVLPASPLLINQGADNDYYTGRNMVLGDGRLVGTEGIYFGAERKGAFEHHAWPIINAAIDVGISYTPTYITFNTINANQPVQIQFTRTINESPIIVQNMTGYIYKMIVNGVVTEAEKPTVKIETKVGNEWQSRNVRFLYLPYAISVGRNTTSQMWGRFGSVTDSGKLVLQFLDQGKIVEHGTEMRMTSEKTVSGTCSKQLVIDLPISDLIPTQAVFDVSCTLQIGDITFNSLSFVAGTYIGWDQNTFNGYRAIIDLQEPTFSIKSTTSGTGSVNMTELETDYCFIDYKEGMWNYLDIGSMPHGMKITEKSINNGIVLNEGDIQVVGSFVGIDTLPVVQSTPLQGPNNELYTYIPELSLSGGFQYARSNYYDGSRIWQIYPYNSTAKNILQSSRERVKNTFSAGTVAIGDSLRNVPNSISYLPDTEFASQYQTIGCSVVEGKGPKVDFISLTNPMLSTFSTAIEAGGIFTFNTDNTLFIRKYIPNFQLAVVTFGDNLLTGFSEHQLNGTIDYHGDQTELLLPAGLGGLSLIDERFSEITDLLNQYQALFSNLLYRMQNLEDRVSYVETQIENITNTLNAIIKSLNPADNKSPLAIIANILDFVGNAISAFLPLVGLVTITGGLLLKGIDGIMKGDVISGAMNIVGAVLLSLYGAHKALKKHTDWYKILLDNKVNALFEKMQLGKQLGMHFANKLFKFKIRGARAKNQWSGSYTISKQTTFKDKNAINLRIQTQNNPDFWKIFDWFRRTNDLSKLSSSIRDDSITLPQRFQRCRTIDFTVNEDLDMLENVDVIKLIGTDDLNVEVISYTPVEYYTKMLGFSPSNETLNMEFFLAMIDHDINSAMTPLDPIVAYANTLLKPLKDQDDYTNLEFEPSHLFFQGSPRNYDALLGVYERLASKEDLLAEFAQY